MAGDSFGNDTISLAKHMRDLMSINDKNNEQRFDAIMNRLEKIETSHRDDMNGLGGRVRQVETTAIEHTEKWKGHKEEHVRENRVMLVVSGIGNTIAAIVGMVVKTP